MWNITRWKYWYDSGFISEEINYVDGQETGYAKFYDEAGKLLQEGENFKGKPTGIWKFYKNGVLKREKKMRIK